MKPYERVLAVIEKKPTDRVPVYHSSISSRTASLVLGREAYVGGGIQQYREAVALWNGEDAHREFLERSRQDAIDVAVALDCDLVRPTYWRMNEKPTRRIDENTFMYGNPDAAWRIMRFDPPSELYQTVEHSPRPELTEETVEAQIVRLWERLDGYDPIDETHRAIEDMIEHFEGERSVAIQGGGLGIPNRTTEWFEMIALRPDLVKRYIEVQTEYTLKRINSYSGVNAHIMLGGGDMASNDGPIYSPRFFREVMAPGFKRLADRCRELGKAYCFASDGNLWPIADDLFPVVDGFYEIDSRAGMDLRRLRETYPHLTLIGNISSHTLHMGTKDEVIAETRACLDAAKEYGGIIVGVSNLIVPPTPEENFFAMVETLAEER